MGRKGEPNPASGFASAQLEDEISRAEDGIRTRDPHLGKVFEFVHGVQASPLSWPPVHGTSTESARIRPCCRAVYYAIESRRPPSCPIANEARGAGSQSRAYRDALSRLQGNPDPRTNLRDFIKDGARDGERLRGRHFGQMGFDRFRCRRRVG